MVLNPDDNDLDLWGHFKNGDADSFVKIFKIYYSQLFNYGCKICTDTNLVEDSIQELFIDLWKTNGKADIVSMKGYLFRAFKFKLLKSLSTSNKTNAFSSQIPEYGFEISHETFMIENDSNRERSKKVINAMKELSPRQKEVIYLKFNQNLSYEEVSDIMQINYQAARNLVYQSIKVLKKLMVIFFGNVLLILS